MKNRNHQLLLFLFCCVLLGGCAGQPTMPHPEGAIPEGAILVLDNHGGYSHAGRRVVLLSDASYTDTRYTDVVGDEHVLQGVYTLNAERTLLTLSPAHGEPEQLYRVDYGHYQYWVKEQDRHPIIDPNGEWLRQISLRADVP